jgi:L-arabinose isomerase
MIQGFTVDDLIKYGKAERESDIKKLKEEDAEYYRGEYQISQGLFELAEKRQEERDERRQQRVHAGLEGGRRKKMHSRNYYKKRSYKMRARAYKKK